MQSGAVPSELQRPTTEISRLFSLFQPESIPFTLDADHNLSEFVCSLEDKDCIYLIYKGRLSYFHHQTGLLLESVDAPTLLGLSDALDPGNLTGEFYTETLCEGAWLPACTALSIIDKHQVWPDVSRILSTIVQRLLLRDMYLNEATAYRTLRYLLLCMDKEPDAIKQSVSVMKYLQQRTKLSRSLIAKVVSDLRKGEFIAMNGKYLSQINRLPVDY